MSTPSRSACFPCRAGAVGSLGGHSRLLSSCALVLMLTEFTSMEMILHVAGSPRLEHSSSAKNQRAQSMSVFGRVMMSLRFLKAHVACAFMNVCSTSLTKTGAEVKPLHPNLSHFAALQQVGEDSLRKQQADPRCNIYSLIHCP